MDEARMFVRDFLKQVQSALNVDKPRALVQEVKAVCEGYQEQARGDPRIAIVPLAFWLNFTAGFAEAYLQTGEDEADLLEATRVALAEQIRSLAVNYHITEEALNDERGQASLSR